MRTVIAVLLLVPALALANNSSHLEGQRLFNTVDAFHVEPGDFRFELSGFEGQPLTQPTLSAAPISVRYSLGTMEDQVPGNPAIEAYGPRAREAGEGWGEGTSSVLADLATPNLESQTPKLDSATPRHGVRNSELRSRSSPVRTRGFQGRSREYEARTRGSDPRSRNSEARSRELRGSESQLRGSEPQVGSSIPRLRASESSSRSSESRTRGSEPRLRDS